MTTEHDHPYTSDQIARLQREHAAMKEVLTRFADWININQDYVNGNYGLALWAQTIVDTVAAMPQAECNRLNALPQAGNGDRDTGSGEGGGGE